MRELVQLSPFRPGLIGVVVWAISLAAFSGCSFFVKVPPSYPREGTPVTCTDSYMFPIADTVGTLALGGAALAMVTSHSQGFVNVRSLALTPAVLAGVYAVAATYGYAMVAHCQDVKAAHGESSPVKVSSPRDSARTSSNGDR